MNKVRHTVLVTFAIMAVAANAQQSAANGREAFMKQQAFAEMQRATRQIDLLQNNQEELARRVARLETPAGNNEMQVLRAEVASLKTAISEVRREMQNMRAEIVRDLTSRLAKMPVAQPSQPKPQTRTVVIGPHMEYVVKSGDTLSIIAEAFGTTVSKIKEMNGLRGDNLRVGQKLRVPKSEK